jgi:hypothetical protein
MGRALTHEARMTIIEYMKALTSMPPDPFTAQKELITIRKSKLHNEEDLFILDDFMYKCFLFFSKSEYFTNNEKNCLHKRWGCL